MRIWPEIRYPCWMQYILTRAPSTQKKKWKQCQWPQNLHATSYIPHTLAILRNRSNWHINKSYVTNYVTLHYNKLYTAWSTDAERTPHIYYTYNVKSKIRYTYKRMAFKVPTIYFSRSYASNVTDGVQEVFELLKKTHPFFLFRDQFDTDSLFVDLVPRTVQAAFKIPTTTATTTTRTTEEERPRGSRRPRVIQNVDLYLRGPCSVWALVLLALATSRATYNGKRLLWTHRWL